MSFLVWKAAVKKQFDKMASTGKLYSVNIDKTEFWNLYLDSYPEGTNKLFREKREFDCNNCRHFFNRVGNVVSINNGIVETIWDIDMEDPIYKPLSEKLSTYIKEHINEIHDVFLTVEKNVVKDFNFEFVDEYNSIKWDHLYVEVPALYIVEKDELDSRLASYRDLRNVLKSSLELISIDALDTVLELIATNDIPRGEENKKVLEEFKRNKLVYNDLDSDLAKSLYTWEVCKSISPLVAKLKNHAIGKLLTDLTEGSELDNALRAYEVVVCGINYKRPKAIFTKKMLEDAKKTLSDEGYLDSLERRFATIDDITVNNIMFVNKTVARKTSNGGLALLESLEVKAEHKAKKFNNITDISVNDFISNVLPSASEVEVYMENKHERNLVSLTAPVNKDSNNMFPWSNKMAWVFKDNVADSSMKMRVKEKGGNVNGDVRFSLQWNESGKDNVDLDAHCVENCNKRYEIYFANRNRTSPNGGTLDVDIMHPGREVAVENIVYNDKKNMSQGEYRFYVHAFSGSAFDGFRAEIEFDNEIHYFECNNISHECTVNVASVMVDKNKNLKLVPILPEVKSTKSNVVWGIKTNDFVPVSVICYSPNYWDENSGSGHKHLMFMLKGCVNDESCSGFFNEQLKGDLYRKHRKVFEALSNASTLSPTDNQLSGIAFSFDSRNSLIVKVKGKTERIMKVIF